MKMEENAFGKFAALVRKKFEDMSKQPLFVIVKDKDSLFQFYLDNFPEGTNPIYITRTEHDCNCCKQFIRNIGNLVVIDPATQKLDSVWNVKNAPYPYDVVAKELHEFVTNEQIKGYWFTKEAQYGREYNFQEVSPSERIRWNHFSGLVPNSVRSSVPDALRGEKDANAHVFKRGLEEITPEAFHAVQELIDNNSLYRGAEFQAAVKAMYSMQQYYKALTTEQEKNIFIWGNCTKPGARIRNTAIGTLLINLGEGMDLESAVTAFEKVVAPENYKRTTALITPSMIANAVKKIEELSLEPQLQRRMANMTDISVNNKLWVSGNVPQAKKSALETALLSSVKKTATKTVEGVNQISLKDFLEKVAPESSQMELLVKNKHTNNLVTLTTRASTPEEGETPIFKWNNDFAWAYNGNIADSSITQRVKDAGGNINAALRVSLAWDNTDDLDLHCTVPDNNRLYYGNRNFNGSRVLDVDANGMNGMRSDPVENMAFSSLKNGKYVFFVHQFSRRATSNQGFTLEVVTESSHQQFSFPKNETLENAVTVTVLNGQVVEVQYNNKLISTTTSKNVWGVDTEQFVKVNSILRSPNFWDGQAIGNEHVFFMLDGCKNPEPVRGIFNEYLRPELNEHRKVFEVLGDKTMCPVTDEQLSGLGFSSTKPSSVVVRVTTEQGKKEYTVVV